jgi:hypothetical protein
MSTPSTDKRGTRDSAISHDLVQMADKTSELIFKTRHRFWSRGFSFITFPQLSVT